MSELAVKGASKEILLAALSHVSTMRAFYGERTRVIREELLQRARLATADQIFDNPCGFETATVPMTPYQIGYRQSEARAMREGRHL